MDQVVNGGKLDLGELTTPVTVVSNADDEQEFLRLLPDAGFMLCKLEQPKNLSGAGLAGFEVRSPYVVILSIGPEMYKDYQVGDRIMYAECLNLPKEMLEKGPAWAKKYCWVHGNKGLGRLPRNAEDKAMAPPKPDPNASKAGVDPYLMALLDKAKGEYMAYCDKTGKNPQLG